MRDDEEAALATQVQEIDAFLTTIADQDPRTTTDEALMVDLVMAQVIRHFKGEKRKRGRPDIFASNDPRTFESWCAFRFVQREKQYFRKRVGRVRVPKEAVSRFLEYAQRLYPGADLNIIADYMRTIKKVPIEEEFRTENWRTVNYEQDKNS